MNTVTLKRVLIFLTIPGGVAFVVWLLLWFGGTVEHWRVKAGMQAKNLREVTRLARALEQARQTPEAQRGRKAEKTIASLLPWLEREIRRTGLIGKVRQISPVSVQSGGNEPFREKALMVMAGVSMAEVVSFLHGLEGRFGLKITRGDLKRSPEGDSGVVVSLEIGLL